MPERQISTARSRDKVLGILLPKALGFLWENGKAGELPGLIKGDLSELIELSASTVHKDCMSVSVYVPHLCRPGDQGFFGPHSFRSFKMRCRFLFLPGWPLRRLELEARGMGGCDRQL